MKMRNNISVLHKHPIKLNIIDKNMIKSNLKILIKILIFKEHLFL
jgi:hypothetical protein